MKLRTSRILLVGLAIFFALMLTVQPVMAQTVSSRTSDQSVGPLRPEVEIRPANLNFLYTFNTQLHSLSGLQKGVANADLNIQCPANVIVSGALTTGVPLEVSGAPQQNVPFGFQIGIGVTRELPGLRSFSCPYDATVEAVFDTGQTIDEVTGGRGTLLVQADYYGLVTARVDRPIVQAGPQKEVPFQIQVENLGNARTTLQFEIQERPGGDRWIAAVPDNIILSSPNNPITATSGTVTFQVTSTYKNGWNNEQGLYRLKIASFASDDPEKQGPDVFTNVIVRVRGVYVPALEPIIMLGALVGSALVVRARAAREGDEDGSEEEA